MIKELSVLIKLAKERPIRRIALAENVLLALNGEIEIKEYQ